MATKTFILGNYYMLDGKRFRLIKVSAKTFNFLDEETGRCLFDKAMLVRGYGGDPIPKYDTEFVLIFKHKMEIT